MRNLKFGVLTIIVFYFLGCSNQQPNTPMPLSNANTTPTVEKKNTQLNGKQVMEAFKKASFPISEETVYTEENDPNHLLNRPNQYTEKISWKDSRMEVKAVKTNATLEVFKTDEDATNRKNYVEKISKSVSALNQYIYAHKNVVVRLNHELLPKQAEEYEKVLKEL